MIDFHIAIQRQGLGILLQLEITIDHARRDVQRLIARRQIQPRLHSQVSHPDLAGQRAIGGHLPGRRDLAVVQHQIQRHAQCRFGILDQLAGRRDIGKRELAIRHAVDAGQRDRHTAQIQGVFRLQRRTADMPRIILIAQILELQAERPQIVGDFRLAITHGQTGVVNLQRIHIEL